jgi:hypothetical protein
MGVRVGLRIVFFEACSTFTHVTACTLARSPYVTLYTGGFSHFVTSMTAPIASGWSESCRVGLSPTGKTPPYHGAHPLQTLVFPAQAAGLKCRPVIRNREADAGDHRGGRVAADLLVLSRDRYRRDDQQECPHATAKYLPFSTAR